MQLVISLKYIFKGFIFHETSFSNSFFFIKYLEQEKVSDLLKFWIQAENFSQNVNNIKKSLEEDFKKDKIVNYENLFKQIQNDAIVVYDK